ncbi:MAG: 3'-5' exonuclease [Actinomycetes bacterium]
MATQGQHNRPSSLCLELATEVMHRMKGMEFRAVAVVDAGEGRVPSWVTQSSVDELQHLHDLQRERSLMYVACTRARDYLRISWKRNPSPFINV